MCSVVGVRAHGPPDARHTEHFAPILALDAGQYWALSAFIFLFVPGNTAPDFVLIILRPAAIFEISIRPHGGRVTRYGWLPPPYRNYLKG